MDLQKNYKHYFITGTDTEIGKTTFAIRLMQYFKNHNLQTVGLKPIASGCHITPDGLRNDDALLLANAATIKLAYEEINPFAFKEPIAPHIAAKKTNTLLTVRKVLQTCEKTLNLFSDKIIIEGVGGWLVPLNDRETIADLAVAFDFPIILVVGIKLGCLNHALLTWRDMLAKKVKIVGWVANCIDPDALNIDENITTLENYFSMSPLEVIPFSR